jgi:hypothetical protein
MLQFERRCEHCGIDNVAEHHRQVALFAGRPWCNTLERFWRRRSAWEGSCAEGIDGGTQFLAVAERQAELPEIGIGQGWQHRRVDLLRAKGLGVFRQAYLSQPACNVDRRLLRLFRALRLTETFGRLEPCGQHLPLRLRAVL